MATKTPAAAATSATGMAVGRSRPSTKQSIMIVAYVPDIRDNEEVFLHAERSGESTSDVVVGTRVAKSSGGRKLGGMCPFFPLIMKLHIDMRIKSQNKMLKSDRDCSRAGITFYIMVLDAISCVQPGISCQQIPASVGRFTHV